jgi:DNA-directed RNA polymerase I, II, and III subunit RPABC2
MATVTLTKYEKARIIGTRAVLISQGSPPMIDIGTMTDIIAIATAEYEQNKIPFVLIRKMPNGTRQRIIIGRGPPTIADDE